MNFFLRLCPCVLLVRRSVEPVPPSRTDSPPVYPPVHSTSISSSVKHRSGRHNVRIKRKGAKNFSCKAEEKIAAHRRVFPVNRFSTGEAESIPELFCRNAMPGYLSLSDAWELIPRFDGDDPHDASAVIKACMYVSAKIDPEHKQDLLESVLNTKIQGTAAIVLKRNGVTTFEELKIQLRKLYPLKRPLIVIRSEFKNCRQRSNESLSVFIMRLKRLMNELTSAWSEGVETPREKWTVRKLVRHMALQIFVKGLKEIYRNTKRRCYPELSIAILGAMEEEKVRMFPHLDKITCYWCGSKGHFDEDCFIRMWVERNRQRAQTRRLRARGGRAE